MARAGWVRCAVRVVSVARIAYLGPEGTFTEAALLNDFIWNDLWTFGAVSRHQRSLEQRIRRFLKFNLICSLGIFFNVVILNIEFNWLHMNRYIANLIAIGIVSLWNYKSNKKFSWRVSPQPTVS